MQQLYCTRYINISKMTHFESTPSFIIASSCPSLRYLEPVRPSSPTVQPRCLTNHTSVPLSNHPSNHPSIPTLHFLPDKYNLKATCSINGSGKKKGGKWKIQ